MSQFREALEYHARGRPGKVQIQPTKPTATQADLSLAYSPGVAGPCEAIAANPDDVFRYTNRGNLVAVVTNGTAVLGLGNIGPLAGKPVMEGKAVLFKRFADIDVFDIELATEDPEEIIRTCELLEPTFGGINLEDIRAPDSFLIEDRLRESMNIPVFHDDQHGTAIIAGAGILNSCELTDRDLGDVRVVINGAGAAGIATANFLVELGVPRAQIILCDSRGVIHDGRDDLNEYKRAYAHALSERTLADAMRGSDIFIGTSVADVVDQDMVRSMRERPIVFALANPDPEIPYDLAKEARPDAIVATGRTDFPNQVNNVLGFPYIFRGALDVRAKGVSEGMKVAAARAIARLTREPVPEAVLDAYQLDRLDFGPDYIIPKPFDARVVWHVAPAVAEAATAEGLARLPLSSVEDYGEQLRRRFQSSYGIMRTITVKARREPKAIVFPQGPDAKVLRAARRLVVEEIGRPVILGDATELSAALDELGIDPKGMEFRDPNVSDSRRDGYAQALFQLRARKGMTESDARTAITDPHMFAAIMLHQGDADAVMGGLTTYYATTLRPALQVLPLLPNRSIVFAAYIVILDGRPYFLADCAVNSEPDSAQLAEIALASAQLAREFDVTPHVALLSQSNFGSAPGPEARRVRRAVEICKELQPDLSIDGEMHADTAVHEELLRRRHPFTTLRGRANVLVFPNLVAANSAYKLLHRLGKAEIIGPILNGLSKSVHVAQRDAEVGDLVNLAAIAVLGAQRLLARQGTLAIP